MTRALIVNADDFGQSAGINRGVAEAHERGIVTSASLMVRWPAAASAAAYAREHLGCLSLGLHFDIGEWAYRHETWVPVYQVDCHDVCDEVTHQIETFRELVGCNPTHIDSHQHVHRDEPVRSILRRVSRELQVPLRECSTPIRYCGDFYGQGEDGTPFPEGISVNNLLRILSRLRPGVTELGCHPGLEDDVDSMYRGERTQEVRTLCDPRVREALRTPGIELRTFTRGAPAVD